MAKDSPFRCLETHESLLQSAIRGSLVLKFSFLRKLLPSSAAPPKMLPAKKKKPVFDVIWRDRDIRFDADAREMSLRPGEVMLERLEGVEDTKGNNGEKGFMKVTNLRIIWHSAKMPKINLTIGFGCVTQLTTKKALSKLRGHAESLYVFARNHAARYEFIFTSLNPGSTKLFTTVIAVHKAYETSRPYRELRMRGAIIDTESKLRLLPLEEQYSKIDGVWNLSSDQGNLGSMIITNVRIVWFAASNANFNVSIPYLQVRSCKVRESKFGLALVIETSAQSGEYVLGFKVDPKEKLETVSKEIQSMCLTFAHKPIFGIEYVKEGTDPTEDTEDNQYDDELALLDDSVSRPDAFAAYYSHSVNDDSKRGIVFSEELGLAIEKLKDGFTLQDLWEIKVD